MTYYSASRLAKYHRAIDEIKHLLANPEMQDIAKTIKTSLSSPLWPEAILLEDPSRDFTSILHAVDILIPIHPCNTWLRCVRALLLCAVDYYRAAQEDLDYILALHPTHLAARLIYLDTWYYSRNYQEAFIVASGIIKSEPMCIRAYMYRAVLCKALAHKASSAEKVSYYELALADLERIKTIAPSPELDIQIQNIRKGLTFYTS